MRNAMERERIRERRTGVLIYGRKWSAILNRVGLVRRVEKVIGDMRKDRREERE